MSDGMPVYAKLLASDVPSDWRVAPFENFVFFQEGPGIRNWQYVDRGVPFVNIRCLVDGRLDRASMSSVDAHEAFGKYRHFLLDADDYVVSSSGTLGRIATVQEDDLPCMLNTSVIRMRPRNEQLDRRYLKYFLLSSYYQAQIMSFATGSAQLNYGPSHLRQMFIVAPPVAEQRAIASVLGALDDKIEQNRRTARALEQLARAIFRAWFVDFEPVKAKAAGATAFPSMPQPVFDALPTRFVESEIGPVPEGWEVKALSDACTLISGGTPKRSEATYWGGEVPWYSVKDVPSDGEIWVINTSERITEDGVANSAARIVPKGCTIISARGTVGKLAMAGVPMTFNQSCYGMMPGDGRSFCQLHLLVQTAVAELQQRTHGSVFDTITRATFDSLLVALPPREAVTSFESEVAPLFDLLLTSLQESSKLAAMRDYLLPKLLSGQVRVEAADG